MAGAFVVSVLTAARPVLAQGVASTTVFGVDLCPQGCSMNDQDGDGIPDDYDACPAEAETVNGFHDGDGCPDTALAEVAVAAQRVFFDRGKSTLRREAVAALGELAQRLNAAGAAVGVLEIIGRADHRGSADANLKLSQARADAVRDWLITRGRVSAERVRAVGAGFLPGSDEETMRINRRVEIRAEFALRSETVPLATFLPIALQSGWRFDPHRGGRPEVVSPQETPYGVYATVSSAERTAVYGRAPGGQEVDLIIFRKSGEPVRAAIRERDAVSIGTRDWAPTRFMSTEGERGAPQLVPFPPAPRVCEDCRDGSPAVVIQSPQAAVYEQDAVAVQVAWLGRRVGDSQEGYRVRLQLLGPGVPDGRTWDVTDGRRRVMTGLVGRNFELRAILVDASGAEVPGADLPPPVRFSAGIGSMERAKRARLEEEARRSTVWLVLSGDLEYDGKWVLDGRWVLRDERRKELCSLPCTWAARPGERMSLYYRRKPPSGKLIEHTVPFEVSSRAGGRTLKGHVSPEGIGRRLGGLCAIAAGIGGLYAIQEDAAALAVGGVGVAAACGVWYLASGAGIDWSVETSPGGNARGTLDLAPGGLRASF
jgi:outer membrane protein OmpA-like peptidoglycan-associated protein